MSGTMYEKVVDYNESILPMFARKSLLVREGKENARSLTELKIVRSTIPRPPDRSNTTGVLLLNRRSKTAEAVRKQRYAHVKSKVDSNLDNIYRRRHWIPHRRQLANRETVSAMPAVNRPDVPVQFTNRSKSASQAETIENQSEYKQLLPQVNGHGYYDQKKTIQANNNHVRPVPQKAREKTVQLSPQNFKQNNNDTTSSTNEDIIHDFLQSDPRNSGWSYNMARLKLNNYIRKEDILKATESNLENVKQIDENEFQSREQNNNTLRQTSNEKQNENNYSQPATSSSQFQRSPTNDKDFFRSYLPAKTSEVRRNEVVANNRVGMYSHLEVPRENRRSSIDSQSPRDNNSITTEQLISPRVEPRQLQNKDENHKSNQSNTESNLLRKERSRSLVDLASIYQSMYEHEISKSSQIRTKNTQPSTNDTISVSIQNETKEECKSSHESNNPPVTRQRSESLNSVYENSSRETLPNDNFKSISNERDQSSKQALDQLESKIQSLLDRFSQSQSGVSRYNISKSANDVRIPQQQSTKQSMEGHVQPAIIYKNDTDQNPQKDGFETTDIRATEPIQQSDTASFFGRNQLYKQLNVQRDKPKAQYQNRFTAPANGGAEHTANIDDFFKHELPITYKNNHKQSSSQQNNNRPRNCTANDLSRSESINNELLRARTEPTMNRHSVKPSIQNDVSSIRNDVSSIRNDVSSIRNDVSWNGLPKKKKNVRVALENNRIHLYTPEYDYVPKKRLK